jgi:hypothetical protein
MQTDVIHVMAGIGVRRADSPGVPRHPSRRSHETEDTPLSMLERARLRELASGAPVPQWIGRHGLWRAQERAPVSSAAVWWRKRRLWTPRAATPPRHPAPLLADWVHEQ